MADSSWTVYFYVQDWRQGNFISFEVQAGRQANTRELIRTALGSSGYSCLAYGEHLAMPLEDVVDDSGRIRNSRFTMESIPENESIVTRIDLNSEYIVLVPVLPDNIAEHQ